MRLKEKTNRCISVGLRVDKAVKENVIILKDPEIPVMEVNQICERCPLHETQCSVRTAPQNVCTRERKEKLSPGRKSEENRRKYQGRSDVGAFGRGWYWPYSIAKMLVNIELTTISPASRAMKPMIDPILPFAYVIPYLSGAT